MGIPVIVIKGILESGKSYFIKDALIRGDFGDLGRVLVLSQEEGITEFDDEFCKKYNVCYEYLDYDEWLGKQINDLVRKHKPQVVFIEQNQTWQNVFMPSYFDVQQVITVIDGSTFNVYFNSMRQFFYDMVKDSELVIINRAEYSQETANTKNNLKMINPSAEIIALDINGNQVTLATELPFDTSGDIIKIGLKHFGAFYLDSIENKTRYENKTVEFECMALFADTLPPKTFLAGRGALTCCVDDIQTIGHICAYTDSDNIKKESWILLTAKVHYLNFNGKEQILLEYLSSKELKKPTFKEQLVQMA